jgi:hypothetical protein
MRGEKCGLVVKEQEAKKKSALHIWHESARAVRKWYHDHKRFFAVSCLMAVSKKNLHNFYFCSKHHALAVRFRLVLSITAVDDLLFLLSTREQGFRLAGNRCQDFLVRIL